MKYFMFYRMKSSILGFATSETDKWKLNYAFNSMEEVEAVFNTSPPAYEYRVIKGTELPWVEEYEEITTVSKRLKSRKLLDEET